MRPAAPWRRDAAAPAGDGATASRVAAAEVLADLRAGHLLDGAFERHAGALPPRDRRWTQELVWGLLRQRAWLDAVLEPRVRGGLARLDDDLADLLRLGLAQLAAMDSVPTYAAVNQTVELAKRRHGPGAGSLANAVLRRVDRDRGARGRAALDPAVPDDPIDALALAHSHPAWLVARWAERFGPDGVARLLAANNREAPVVARPWGVPADALLGALAEDGVEGALAPAGSVWPPDSVRVGRGVPLTALAAFGRGLFHVQDPASTLVTRYAAPPADATVADLCAAPGGKSVELARTAARVLAGDRHEGRVRRVADNVRRLGQASPVAVYPYTADALESPLAPGSVDLVLVDAPCTGTGTFRRHPDARWRLQPSDLAVLPARQGEILDAAAALVRPGGLLVYSTCSLELEENDEPVDAFLGRAGGGWVLEPPPAGTVPEAVLDRGRLRVLPHEHGGAADGDDGFGIDGAFAVRLRRVAG